MRVISTALASAGVMLGLHVVVAHDDVISLFVAHGKGCEFLPTCLTFCVRYSILPALSLDGILHIEVLDHSFTGEEFGNFIEGVLDQMQPWPLPNSVLVLDNARIHKVPGIREMVEERCVVLRLCRPRNANVLV
jgi:hypothetical protein